MLCIINQFHLHSLALFEVAGERALDNLELVSSDFKDEEEMDIDREIDLAEKAQTAHEAQAATKIKPSKKGQALARAQERFEREKAASKRYWANGGYHH